MCRRRSRACIAKSSATAPISTSKKWRPIRSGTKDGCKTGCISCELTVTAAADDVVKFLTGTNLLSGVNFSPYHSPPKVSFLVERFSKVQTVEGLTNNFYYPI
jgi:hypothetical protein